MTGGLEVVATERAAPPPLEILPCGVRLVRLGPGETGWFVEYAKILRLAAEDFLRRAEHAGTAEGVLAELQAALARPEQAVWLILRPDYSLLGFALAELGQEFGGPRYVCCVAAYLYPPRPPRSVLPALARAILAWGRPLGATSLEFWSRRPARAWAARLGATSEATRYSVPITTRKESEP